MTYKKLQQFKDRHSSAIDNILGYLQPDQYAPNMHELALWLLETEHNPYAYLDHNYALYMSDAIGFEMILDMLYHALYDDGEVAFVAVDNRPRIVFYDRWDDNFRLRCLMDSEQEIESRGYRYTVQVLDIEPNEFGALYDEYVRQRKIKYVWVDELIESNNKKG